MNHEVESQIEVTTKMAPEAPKINAQKSGGRPAPSEAAPEAPPAVLAVQSIDELPAVLSAREWQSLQGRLEWNSSRRLFLLRPEWDFFAPPFKPFEPRSEPPALANDAPSAGSPLRPRTLADYVGQARAVTDLELAILAARDRREPLGHVLLTGPAGLGKTTLAHVLASEMETQIRTSTAAVIEDPQQLTCLLTRLRPGEILFIDEIHRLSRSCEEFLYGALEDTAIDVLLGQGPQVRPIRIILEPFTLIGATTEPAALSEPFRARFKLQERLEFYSREELAEVVRLAAQRLRKPVTCEGSQAIACRSRGVPREAIRILERARDLAQALASAEIGPHHVEKVAGWLGIDENGLWPDDREILRLLLSSGRPIGIETIAMTLSMDPATVRLLNEPHLLAQAYIVRTARGRQATLKARRDYGALSKQEHT